MAEEVTLEAHFDASSSVGIGDAARRLMIQEDIIAHMVKTVCDNVTIPEQFTAEDVEGEARRVYFLIVGFMQAAQDFGVLPRT